MFAKSGWVVLGLSIAFFSTGTLFFVEMIEADDPTNPAVVEGFHYPGGAWLYVFLASILLAVASLISLLRKEPLRYSTLVFAVPCSLLIISFLMLLD